MKPAAFALAILTLSAGPVSAQEKPLSFEFSESAFSEAVRVIATAAGVEISVEEDLAALPVTLSAKDIGLEACLALLAKLAGPDVEWRKVAEGKYAIARKVPEWKAALLAKLDAVRVNLDFKDTPVEEVARFLAEFSGASVAIDPECLAEMKPDERNLTLMAKEVSLRSALDLLTALKGLAWGPRWGVVFVAGPERMKELPAALLPAPAAEASEAEGTLRGKLAKLLALDFAKLTLSEGLAFVAGQARMTIRYGDEAAEKYAQETPVSVALQNVTVEQALSLLLLPRGFRAEVTEGALVLTRP
jgi:hypothetical protein